MKNKDYEGVRKDLFASLEMFILLKKVMCSYRLGANLNCKELLEDFAFRLSGTEPVSIFLDKLLQR